MLPAAPETLLHTHMSEHENTHIHKDAKTGSDPKPSDLSSVHIIEAANFENSFVTIMEDYKQYPKVTGCTMIYHIQNKGLCLHDKQPQKKVRPFQFFI